MAALRLAKEKGVPVMGIVNVVGSSIARESDYVMYTYAGPEISVATTKAYSTQLIAVYLLAIQAAKVRGLVDEERYVSLLQELGTLPDKIQVKSRGAYLMGLTNYGNYSIEDTADFSVYVPKTEQYFTTSLAIVPLQLMGYYVSVAKGLDVDKPRNLAKSVTVE